MAMFDLSFLHLALGYVPWVWQCLIYFSYTMLGHTLGMPAYACFTFLPYMIALCMIHDGLSWLYERSLLTMSTPNPIVWVCVQGICCRCIFMLYCVHGHRGVMVPIHVTWVTMVSQCMRCELTCLMLWRASSHLSRSILIHIVYIEQNPASAL